MRNLRIIEHISLDGVIQQSGDDDDFPYGDWKAPYRTSTDPDEVLAAQGVSFDLLLGRRTYDIWSGFWPKVPSSPMADGLNAAQNILRPTVRKVLNGDRSRALGRTSSRAFAASSRRTARTLSFG